MYESQQGPEICDVSPCIWDKLGLRLRNYSMVTNLSLRVSQYDLLTKYRRSLCTFHVVQRAKVALERDKQGNYHLKL